MKMAKRNAQVFIPALLLFTCSLLLPGQAPGGDAPGKTVQQAVDAIIVLLQDESLGREQKRGEIRRIVKERFDFRAMSQRTLATNWKKASKEEQQQFVDLFAKLIENSYIGKIETYSGETVEYPGENIKGKRATVETLIITSSAEIPVSYRMYLRKEDWRVYDVVIEGVSLVNSYRSTYQEIIKKDGFPGLFAKMEKKIRELDEGEKQPS